MPTNLFKTCYRPFFQTLLLVTIFLIELGCGKLKGGELTNPSNYPPSNNNKVNNTGITPVTDEMIQLVENKLAKFLAHHGWIVHSKELFLANKLRAIKEKRAYIDINEPDADHPHQMTALHYATYLDDKSHGPLIQQIIQVLLDQGANINVQDKQGYSPLSLAVKNNHLETVKYLVSHGANKELCDKNYMTPLHWAASQGNLEITRFLVENGANIQAQEYHGYTPLYFAEDNGYGAVARFLRSKLGIIDQPCL